MTATLIGVGVGPGNPDLITVGAIKALRDADVVIAPTIAIDSIGRAESIVRQAVPEITVHRLVVSMSPDEHERLASQQRAAMEIAKQLCEYELVAFITLGDPNIYSTFSSLTVEVRKLMDGVDILTIPGIMAFQELAARTNTVVLDSSESLTLVTALDDTTAISEALSDPERALVVYKGGRQLPIINDLLLEHGRLDNAVLGELMGLPGERVGPAKDAPAGPSNYLATMIIPPKARPAP